MNPKLIIFLPYSLLHETQGKMIRKCNIFSKGVDENRYDISKKSTENRKVFKITTTLD